ncbi:MAG: hypothetical protein ACF8XB_14790 [Planctomycetota bacterium JB042]
MTISMPMPTSRPLLTLTLSLALGVSGAAQTPPEKPMRQPDGGHFLEVSLHVPFSALDIASGPDATFEGTVWIERLSGRKYRGATTMMIESRAGSEITLPPLDFKTDADSDPIGEPESLGTGLPSSIYLHRLLSSSDFSLLPLRAVLPHAMPYTGRSRDAKKEYQPQGMGAVVEMHERDLGIKRVGAFPLTRHFYRSVRRFQPSGWELHDYIYSAEEKDDEAIFFSCGLRLLAHPTATLPDGTRPDSGVFHVASFNAVYLDWFGAAAVNPSESDKLMKPRDREGQYEKYRGELQNALYDALQSQGLGNPFDSPATFAMQHAELIDERLVQRLINLGNAKVLAQVAPALVEDDVAFDGKTHLKLWKEADDPTERLLLAAAAAKGGASDDDFLRECRLAVNSKSRTVRRAAWYLAKALGDADLERKAAAGL